MNKGEIKFFSITIFLIALLTSLYFILNSQQPVKAEQPKRVLLYQNEIADVYLEPDGKKTIEYREHKFFNGSNWEKVNLTVIPSSNPLYDFEVTKNYYKVYFNKTHIVDYFNNSTFVTIPLPLSLSNYNLTQFNNISVKDNKVIYDFYKNFTILGYNVWINASLIITVEEDKLSKEFIIYNSSIPQEVFGLLGSILSYKEEFYYFNTTFNNQTFEFDSGVKIIKPRLYFSENRIRLPFNYSFDNNIFKYDFNWSYLKELNFSYPIIIDPTKEYTTATTECGDVYDRSTGSFYDNITIDSGITVTICAWNGAPQNCSYKSTGDSSYIASGCGYVNFTTSKGGVINVYGNIEGTEKGYRGGSGAGSQAYQGESYNGTGSALTTANAGGGGGGKNYCTSKPCSTIQASGGNTYGESRFEIYMGSGGGGEASAPSNVYAASGGGGGGYGGSGGAGGVCQNGLFSGGNAFTGKSGGGLIILNVSSGSINVYGIINVSGGGNSEEVGAGSGGGILLYGKTINISGSTLLAKGGSPGSSGTYEDTQAGGGGGGRIKIFYKDLYNASTTIDVSGGITSTANWCTNVGDVILANPMNGTTGTIYYEQNLTLFNINPFAYQPKFYNENYQTFTRIPLGSKVIMRINITDDDGATDLKHNQTEWIRPDGSIAVSNLTMAKVADITNGYTFEYNFTVDKEGTWTVKGYANDSANVWVSNSSTFIVGSPKWSNLQTSIPETWDYNTKSYFNITWNDTLGYNIDTVLFESNFSGTPTNYTMSLIDPYINATEKKGVYNFNATLPAGTFYWKSYANASDGVWNFTPTYYFTKSKAWNQTDNIKAGEEYEYDLGKLGRPISINIVNIIPYNSSIVVGEPVFAYYNLSINNTNNDTGLTTTFTNVFANFSKHINLSVWQNISSMENTFSSLAYNSPQYFIVNVSNITAYETSYSCSATYYQSWKKYDCNFGVYVIENNITPTLPIYYYIDYNVLPEWSSRDKSATNWYVDATTKGVSYEEDDVNSKINFVVDTTHSSSSLDEGLHNFEVIYYIPIITGGGGGGGGGGAVPQPQPNVSFEIFPTEITILANPGESKLITPYGSEHTFSIKNLGINPIFIKIEKSGDYKDFISTTAITQYQIYYQQPEYIAIDPGKEKFVDFYTNIPLDAKSGSYQIIINFVDRDSKVYQTAKINLLVGGPVAVLGKIEKILFYPLSFSPNYNFTISKEGIYLKGLNEVSFPIGWLLIILSLAIPYFITSYILRIRGRKIKNKYKVLIALISSFIIFVMFILILVGGL
jgi:hypothetical protein